MKKARERKIKDCTVLIVDDQATIRLVIRSMLEKMVHCVEVESAEEAISYCLATPPDLVIMDVIMPGMNGHKACKQLADDPKTHTIPVIFVTGSDSDEDQLKCWQAGAADYVTKPINAITLKNRVKLHLSHKLKTDLLEKLIYIDSLTDTFNRHYLEERVPRLILDCQRRQQPISVVMLDIDNFKRYNDGFGHPQGDKCLKRVAQTIRTLVHRPLDAIIRVGGEEFLLVLPHTNVDGASQVAERIRQAVEAMAIPQASEELGVVTISAGVAGVMIANADSLATLISHADRNLYLAKKQGRNRVINQDFDDADEDDNWQSTAI